MMLEKLIGTDDDGKKITSVLKYGMGLSNRIISRLKFKGGICVNGAPVFTNYVCREGDHVTVNVALIEPLQGVPAEQHDLTILFGDEYILAVYKPEGLLTHPSRTQFTGSLMGYVLGYLSKSDATNCHAINRLDRYTSGIVLFAKSTYAKSLFTQSMQNAKKTYIAVVFGRVVANSGTINLPIMRLQSGNIRRGVSIEGDTAITHYQVLDIIKYNGSDLSVLKLEPETGRTHQLRVHCLAMGHPIIGDQIYYNERSKALSDKCNIHGQLLHAERLRFFHPITNNNIDIHCTITRKPMLNLLGLNEYEPSCFQEPKGFNILTK